VTREPGAGASPQPRIIVVGLGSIGRRHLANLRGLGCEVAVLRRSPADAAVTTAAFDVLAFDAPGEAAAWGPTHAIVANATSAHAATIAWALDTGCHVLVEKPISSSLRDVDTLLDRADALGRIVAVGSNLRFHPAVETIRTTILRGGIGRLLTARAEVGAYLPGWHPDADYRTEYSARAELGGGALLTLIHELDLMTWIAGPVTYSNGCVARVSDLEIDVDDLAELVCVHDAGPVTSVHMDFVDRAYNRRSRWIGSAATLEWHWQGDLLRLDGDRRETLWSPTGFDYNSTYVRELEDFLAASREHRAPRTTGRDARHTLQVALSIPARGSGRSSRDSVRKL
jgi:predicted dehydrogenase